MKTRPSALRRRRKLPRPTSRISNLEYKDGKFSLVEKSKNALAGIVLEALNNVFATDGSRKIRLADRP